MSTMLGVRPPIRTAAKGAAWLLFKYEKLRNLCERIGAYADGQIDLTKVREAVVAEDTHRKRWANYERQHPMPFDEDNMAAWLTTGPQPSDEARIVSMMSSDEIGQLRLVATLAPHNYPTEAVPRVGFAIDDLCTFDEEGRQLLLDYLHVIRSVYRL